MTDENLIQSDSKIIAQLTAYLDGELDEAEVRNVEERISSSARHQKLLHQLQQTWDVLDVLPSAVIGAARDFTQSTMKLAVKDAHQLTTKKNRSFWTWPLRILALCLIPCVASAGTFLTSRYLQNIPVQQLESNLSVIRNLDAYLYDKNLTVEFLERLANKNNLFRVAIKPIPAVEDELSLTNNELLTQFDSLSEPQKQRIRANFQRFQDLSSAESTRIKSLHAQIIKHPRSEALRRTLYEYHQWIRTLWETETAKILDTANTDERINLIDEITLAKYDDSFGTGIMGLPERDKKSIYLGLLNLVSNQDKRRQMDLQIAGSQLDYIELYALTLYPEGSDEQDIFRNGMRLKLIYENDRKYIDRLITDDDLQTIKLLLSDEALSVVNDTINWPNNHDKSEAQLLVHWMIEVFNSDFSPPNAPADIQEVYENLKPEERDAIDNEHPADRKKRLEKKLKELNEY